MTDTVGAQKSGRVRLLYRVIAYVGAWIVALLLTAPGMWPLAYLFPLGLIAVFNRHLANDGGWGVFIGLYLVYIVHGYFYFRSKTTIRTVILFGVLAVLLTCNVAGCREMIYSH
jgi:hypothetical protein